MDFLPKTLGTRPRVAVEIRTEGVVAARAEDAAGVLVAISRADLVAGALVPGLKRGNVMDRKLVASAVRAALEDVAGRGAERTRYVTLIVPDAAVRVLLLDFDSLPGKVVEALPIVRFRLKKLLPFEVEDSVVSYQIMSSVKGLVNVVAVAIPREVLAEYEGVVTDAGYLPGAVLPSTLASLAAFGVGAPPGRDEDRDSAVLFVNAGAHQVTTAIVRGGVLLLHRTIEVSAGEAAGQSERESSSAVKRGGAEDTGGFPRDFGEAAARDTAQAVSVAVAYFEDTLGSSPETLFSAGASGSELLARVLEVSGLTGLRVRELIGPEAISASMATARTPRGWLAGVKGALTS